MSVFRTDAKWLREYAARQAALKADIVENPHDYEWKAGMAMHDMRSDAEHEESVRAAAIAPFDSAYKVTYALEVPKSGPRVSLVLPWPTNVNHYWRPNGRGGKLLTDETKQFRAEVAATVLAQPLKAPFFPMIGRLRVTIHATEPRPKRKRDLDGVLKSLLDALQHAGVYADDSQIDDLRILRTQGKPGTVAVFIETIRQPGDE